MVRRCAAWAGLLLALAALLCVPAQAGRGAPRELLNTNAASNTSPR